MGGPWTYETTTTTRAGMSEADEAYYAALLEGIGAGMCGRGMYDSAGAWGGTNPFPGTLVVLTHRTEDQPDESGRLRVGRRLRRGVRAGPGGGRQTAASRSAAAPT